MTAAMWSFSDLDNEELAYYTTLPCDCKPPTVTGTRHGYTCAAHRAQAEIDRRKKEAELELWHTLHD